MKAIIILGTPQQKDRPDADTLTEFLYNYFPGHKIDFEVIKLMNHKIFPDSFTQIDANTEDWPTTCQKIMDARILIVAAPRWWNSHADELQRSIDRLSEVYDMVLEENAADVEKLGGVIITGDELAVAHITRNICQFLDNLGVSVPFYLNPAVIWEDKPDAEHTGRIRFRDFITDAHMKPQQFFHFSSN